MMASSFSIWGLTIHFYGLLLGLAVITVLSISEKVIVFLFPRGEVARKTISDSFWWVLLAGLTGARLYHVWDYWSYYQSQPQLILALWQGGLGIYGALAGGVVGVWFFSLTRRHKEQGRIVFWGILDAISVGLPLGQTLGRLGNFVNQELYGKPTNAPWALFIDMDHRLPGYEHVEYYHPLFLYEGIWNVIGFYFLFRLAKNNRLQSGKGNYFVLYLFWYSTGRSILEYLRIDPWVVGFLPMATLLGVVIMITTSVVYLWKRRRHEWSILVD